MLRNNSRSLPALLLVLAGVLLVSGALFWFYSSTEQSTQPQTSVIEDIPFPDVQRVSLADAYAAYELKNAVFVDVRDLDFYNLGHIPGARSIPLDQILKQLPELNPSDWIILYCT